MANKEKKGFKKAKTEKKPKDFSKVKKVAQNKIFKGVSVAVAPAFTGAGVTYLTTNSNPETKALATTKGDTIIISDFYNVAKSTSSSQQTMLSLTLSCVFEDQYGDKVSNDDVSEAYNTIASSYGSSFPSALPVVGLTSDTHKQQIRTSMLVEYAVKQVAKKKSITKNHKAAYEDYNPDTIAIATALSDEGTANSVHDQATADGADFETTAKDNTIADKTEYTFDSADTDLPEDVMNAVLDQDEGSVPDVIKVLDTSACSYTYYIVEAIKKTEKDSGWKTHKKRLKKIILAQYESDIDFQDEVTAKALDKANMKVKDDSFAGILSQYATSSSSSSSSSSSPSSSSSSSSDDSSSSSSTEESSTTRSLDE